MQIDVKITGLKPFGKDIAARISAINNLTPAFKSAVVLYHGWVLRNFAAQGRLHEDSTYHWKPLKDTTIQRRRKKGGGAKILMDTGSLRRDWDMLSGSTYGIIRSRHAYSGVHEDGTKTAGKKRNVTIPQRKIFPTVAQAQKIIEPAFENHIFGKA